MALSVRPEPYMIPAYSLTGDLLAYLNCGLQYRYQNRGALPPSKPVQLWFGQFIHGVMEEAYRTWRSGATPLPWSDTDIQPITDAIIARLAARGLHYQRQELLEVALERARVSINTWGAYLFPLIAEAEVRLKGIRRMPPGTVTIRRSNYYEVEGVVDVLTSFELSAVTGPNPIVSAVLSAIAPQTYEVIVDYKGMRRPRVTTDDEWIHQEWQILTYAWLREQQPESNPVKSGVLIYIDELVPSETDMDELYEEVLGTSTPQTDVAPTGSDLQALQNWPHTKVNWHQPLRAWRQQMNVWRQEVSAWRQTGRAQGQPRPPMPQMPQMPQPLSMEFRLRRSLRVIPIQRNDVDESLARFDGVVSEIEGCVAQESAGQVLTTTWPTNPRDKTCVVCDFKTFCPNSRYRGAPPAP